MSRKNVAVEYDIDEIHPGWMDAVFIQLFGDVVQIGITKSDGTIYHCASVEIAEFFADVDMLRERANV